MDLATFRQKKWQDLDLATLKEPEFELFSCNIFFAQKDGTNSDWTNIIPTLNDGHAMTSVSGAR